MDKLYAPWRDEYVSCKDKDKNIYTDTIGVNILDYIIVNNLCKSRFYL